MSQFLPTGGHKWINKEQINNLNNNLSETTNMFKNLNGETDIGYLVEVDLEYPINIKEYTKNFPLAPVKRTVKYEELSDYQHFLIKDKRNSTRKIDM